MNMQDDALDVSDYLRRHIRTVPDWPAPGRAVPRHHAAAAGPKSFRVLIDAFVHRYMDRRPDVVAGLDARGFILGAVVAYELGVGFVPIRKKASCPSPRWRKPTSWSTAVRRWNCTPTP
jgi:adenine phosphoribosyltransferase